MTSNRHRYLLAAFLLLISGRLAAAELIASPDEADDCGDGAGGLQSCLDVAASNGQGDTVRLTAGTFDSVPYVYSAIGTHEDQGLEILGSGDKESSVDGLGFQRGLQIVTSPGDSNSKIVIRNLLFTRGSSSEEGGGLGVLANWAPILIENCKFQANVSATSGGGVGIQVLGGGSIEIVANEFLENTANDGGGAFAKTSEGDVLFSGNDVGGNLANANGGGAFLVSTEGGMEISDNLIRDNAAGSVFGGSGGGVIGLIQGVGGLQVHSNRVSDNLASRSGAGIFAQAEGGDLLLTNNLVSRNLVAGSVKGDGGGMKLFLADSTEESPIDPGRILLINNTVSENSSDSIGGGVSLVMDRAEDLAELTNNIVFGNVALNTGNDIYLSEDLNGVVDSGQALVRNNLYSELVSECAVAGGSCLSGDDNLVDVSPLFVSAVNSDFHLAADSPAIEAGTLDSPDFPTVDLDGQARPSPSQSLPDLGALEFTGDPEVSGDGGCVLSQGDERSWGSRAGFGLIGVAIAILGRFRFRARFERRSFR